MFAITPKGIGKKVGARSINPDWDLAAGETFTVEDFNADMVLAEDSVSIRQGTELELADPVDNRSDIKKIEDATGLTKAQIKSALEIT